MRRSVPGRALVALVLLALLVAPSISLAEPSQGSERKPPAERTTGSGLFLRLWSNLVHLWGQEGSGLDPDGRMSQTGAQGGGATPTGDTGSGLDPDGK